jgi:HPt (histidine-containing phosphotransfer) domain-containing protein
VLPGIDTHAGLRRVAGNVPLYRRLLNQLADGQRDAAERVRAALQAGDFEVALRAAHSLRGVAGNLGADALAERAGAVEAALRANPDVLPADALDALDRAIADMVESVSVLAEGAPIAAAPPPAGGTQDRAACRARAGEIQALVEQDLSEALEALERLVAQAPPGQEAAMLAQALAKLQCFELDEATRLLRAYATGA